MIGAGPTGLSAAYHLGSKALIIEQNSHVGGLCSSIKTKGFTFDYAGHIMFSENPYILQLYELLLGENLHWQERQAWIYSKNTYTRYPFQSSLYGLPPEVIKECLVGLIKAHFGTSLEKEEKIDCDCCADGSIPSFPINTISTRNGDLQEEQIAKENDKRSNFKEFIFQTWGDGIAKHFAIPYNEKLWGTPLERIETSWIEGRVPLPDLEEVICGAFTPSIKSLGPNARFGYPLQGGFQSLMDGFIPLLKNPPKLESKVISISPKNRSIELQDRSKISYQWLVSTMPLPKLIEAIGEEAPETVRSAAKELEHLSVRCINIGIKTANPTEKHWIYYPEPLTHFHRIFVQGNASPHCNPPGGLGLICEISYSDKKPLPCEGQELEKRGLEECYKVGIIQPEDEIITVSSSDIPFAYVVYTHKRNEAVHLIRTWLKQYNILLAGRYSEWEYYNSDHAFLSGKRAADMILENL